MKYMSSSSSFNNLSTCTYTVDQITCTRNLNTYFETIVIVSCFIETRHVSHFSKREILSSFLRMWNQVSNNAKIIKTSSAEPDLKWWIMRISKSRKLHSLYNVCMLESPWQYIAIMKLVSWIFWFFKIRF